MRGEDSHRNCPLFDLFSSDGDVVSHKYSITYRSYEEKTKRRNPFLADVRVPADGTYQCDKLNSQRHRYTNKRTITMSLDWSCFLIVYLEDLRGIGTVFKYNVNTETRKLG